MIPINGEWACCDCLSKSDAMDEIVRVHERLAAAEAEREEARQDAIMWTLESLKVSKDLTECRRLLREAREAYRTGYVSDCVPLMRLLYLSDRWDDEAAKAAGGV